ncbi:MAG: lipopolysaccharide biosynthesis protein [Clostridia bacterium]|nr:lipopolysaccharide biosynthesis protein [Clostridia bacterium]MBQ8399304.1 lipopolysaccharide biosynthesis protein [Clostridia bacterium]
MVNILFCGNDKVFDGALTCALSILKRTSNPEPFTFYIFTMDATHIKESYRPISDRQCAFFEEVVKKHNPENRVVKIDVSALYKKEFDRCPNEDAYCSPYTLLRLLADLVEGMPNKILYLDIDVLFNRDIHLLYDKNIEGYEYAAARDHYGKYLIYPNYINAGVLLLNLREIKRTGLLKKARRLIQTKKLVFADQSALIRATKHKKVLPQRFNDQKFLHKHTVVRHFSKRLFWLPYPHTDNIKQWQVGKVQRVFRYDQFDDVLYEYIYLREKFNEGAASNE